MGGDEIKSRLIWKRNNRLIKLHLLNLSLSSIGILFFILIIIHEGPSIIIIIGIFILIIVSFLLSFYFWKIDPHYYKIIDNGLYLKYTKYQKLIKWNDIEKIDKKFKVNIFGDTTKMIITKNNEKYNIGAFFNQNVVNEIIKKYNEYKKKNEK